ncbi:MAG: ATP-binding protein [Gammaproteobacteria bacterium]|nr:ATP-binding protein [Gammaproteobacteria bacterium]
MRADERDYTAKPGGRLPSAIRRLNKLPPTPLEVNNLVAAVPAQPVGVIDTLSAVRLLNTLSIEHMSDGALIGEILEILLIHQDLANFTLYLVREGRTEYIGSKNWHTAVDPQTAKLLSLRCEDGTAGTIEDNAREVVETGSVLRRPAVGPDGPGQPGAYAYLCLPIPAGTRTVGVLCVYDADLDSFPTWDESALHLLCSVLGNVLRNYQLVQDRQQALDEREADNRELEAFTHSVSHDLRAPLRSIQGFSQILLEDYGASLDEVGRAHVRRCVVASKRMAMSMDRLLELNRGRYNELNLSEINVSCMAGEILSDLHRDEPARDVDWSVGKSIAVDADPVLLRLVLENLIGNAWKYTRHRNSARVRVSSRVAVGECIVEISDNGIGFAQEESDRLFVPFHRLHSTEEFEGSGIGLATVRRIIERHGGRVWATGAVGTGATFSLSLPLKSVAA